MRFHGDTYEWRPGEELKMTEDAARHIFGYGLTDKTTAFQRTGWLNSTANGTLRHATAKLQKFDFRPVQQIFELAVARKSGESERPLALAGEDGQEEEKSSSSLPDAAAG